MVIVWSRMGWCTTLNGYGLMLKSIFNYMKLQVTVALEVRQSIGGLHITQID